MNRLTRAHAAVLVLLTVLVLAGSSTHAALAAAPADAHVARSLLPLGPLRTQGTPPPANYDEQIGITFTQGFTSIAYNVTAVLQTDANGYGPGYLLNGLTDAGYWYQVGLSYDWAYASGGYNQGVGFNFEVFNSFGKSVFPANGAGGLGNFTGPVNNGDSVLLNLTFSGSEVDMFAKDWNTGATGSETYFAQGTHFVGMSLPSDSNGFFTGLMTEWYHAGEYFGTEGRVTYSDAAFALTSGIVWADEFNSNTSASVFDDSGSYSFSNPTQLQSFFSNGASAYADAYTFITGSLNEALLTLSYGVSGGGSGYSAPILSYTLDGVPQTATLTSVPTTFFADIGSTWSLPSALPGSSETERWATDQQASGSASSLTEVVVYNHQFLTTFAYAVSGGGTGYSPPQVQSTLFGAPSTTAANTPAWVDAGSAYSYPTLLPGSSSSERWISPDTTGTVSGQGEVEVTYYHQFGVTISYSLAGGGSPGVPNFTGTEFGKTFSAQVGNSTIVFVDSGTLWSFPALLPGSNSQERWVTTQTTGGSASEPVALAVVYRHQYNLTISAAPSAGGSTNLARGWEDAGSTLQLSQTTSSGWKFEGWIGSGAGSYTGSSNSTSVKVDSAITESATFYPGLKITAGDNGQISFNFGTTTGAVLGGTSTTIYAPVGTKVTLRASSSLFLYEFSRWTLGASGSASTTSIVLSSPSSVQGSFTMNYVAIGGIVGLILIAVLASVLALRSRHHAPA